MRRRSRPHPLHRPDEPDLTKLDRTEARTRSSKLSQGRGTTRVPSTYCQQYARSAISRTAGHTAAQRSLEVRLLYSLRCFIRSLLECQDNGGQSADGAELDRGVVADHRALREQGGRSLQADAARVYRSSAAAYLFSDHASLNQSPAGTPPLNIFTFK